MCGFVGVIDPQGVCSRVVGEMTQVLSHRGPDDVGFLYFDPQAQEFVQRPYGAEVVGTYPFAMGFRRLSILDLSEMGRQPMLNQDGRFAITYNGEIYNFLELRDELTRLGYRFRSRSDTEVLLYMYEEYGTEMLPRLNGMFAFAIFDKLTQTVFLARDRMGIKPIYYYRKGSCFLYASEVKAFFSHPAFHPEINGERLSEYFLFRYVAGTDSLLKGVRSIEPGTYMIIRNGEVSTHVYWKVPPYEPRISDLHEAKSKLGELMQSSVNYQLISDVKVGCQLSGGIDSSIVSYWAAKQHEGLFDSVSIIFRDHRYSEEPHIDHVNRVLGLVDHKVHLDLDFVVQHLASATWHNDFPLSHPNSMGIFLLSMEAKKHVTVLLSGEGADEVFGGYPRFYHAARLLYLNRLPKFCLVPPLRAKLMRLGNIEKTLLGLSAFGDPALIPKVFPRFDLQQALAPGLALWRGIEEASPLERLLTYEQRTYLVDLLLRQDKMSMAHGIENRVPYLDHRIVEFAKRVQTTLKVRLPLLASRGRAVYNTKRILKHLAADYYGRSFAYRPKSGFPIPLDELFANEMHTSALDPFFEAIPNLGICDRSDVVNLRRAARENRGGYSQLLWIVLALGTWWSVISEASRRRPALAEPLVTPTSTVESR